MTDFTHDPNQNSFSGQAQELSELIQAGGIQNGKLPDDLSAGPHTDLESAMESQGKQFNPPVPQTLKMPSSLKSRLANPDPENLKPLKNLFQSQYHRSRKHYRRTRNRILRQSYPQVKRRLAGQRKRSSPLMRSVRS